MCGVGSIYSNGVDTGGLPLLFGTSLEIRPKPVNIDYCILGSSRARIVGGFSPPL